MLPLSQLLPSDWMRSLSELLPSDPTLAKSIVGVGCVVPLVVIWLLYRSVTKKKTAPNGIRYPRDLPTKLPFLGDFVELLRNMDRRHDWIRECCEQFQGEAFGLQLPSQPNTINIYKPEHVEEVLKTHFDHMPKGPVQCEIFRDLLGDGIFAVDGAKWVHQRKTASNLFTARALRETMTESMRRYAIVLERILGKASASSDPIDVFKLMNRFTIEAFAKMGFGIEMNALESDEDHPFQHAFDSAQRMLLLRFMRPMWFWKTQRFFSIGSEGQLHKDIAVIDKTVLDIVAQSLAKRQARGPNNHEGGGDIVSLFLDRFDASQGAEFDPKYLRDIVVNFLIAGRDTTAQAMSWCFYNLSKHPQVVQKIRAEIQQHLPDFASGRRTDPPTMDEVQQLVYLDATLKETLRLHPSVPALPKWVTHDTVLADGTLLSAGTEINIPTYAMARMEFIWGPDAKAFKPERWIDSATGKTISVSAFKFASFNAGPRLCLGMNLAMLEMKIVMATVLSGFNVDLVPGQEITYDNSLTLPVKGALWMRVTPFRLHQ